MKVDFECKKCGLCCKEVKGMPIFHDKLKVITALTGISPRARPVTEEVWALEDRVCPFLGDDNTCACYDKRPLTCLAFPFLPKGNNIAVAEWCPGVTVIEGTDEYDDREHLKDPLPEVRSAVALRIRKTIYGY